MATQCWYRLPDSLDFRPEKLFKTGVGKTGVEPPASYIAEEGHLQKGEKKKKKRNPHNIKKKKLEGEGSQLKQLNTLGVRETPLSQFSSFLCKPALATAGIQDSDPQNTFPVK